MNIFVRYFFTTFDGDYYDKHVLMNLYFCMAMKHHPKALWKADLINSIVANILYDFNMTFDNFIKFRVLILLQKFVNEQIPEYLFKNLVFSKSARSRFVNQINHKYKVSERQFLIFATRLWNSLSSNINSIKNTGHFKKILSRRFL